MPTFGFTTAVAMGTDLVKHLMKGAATTDKGFFVTVMGRHTGHLALGIGGAAAATLTVIGEEFADARIPLAGLVDIWEGAIIIACSGPSRVGWSAPTTVSATHISRPT